MVGAYLDGEGDHLSRIRTLQEWASLCVTRCEVCIRMDEKESVKSLVVKNASLL
jgi:hypothetical protein